MGLVPQCMAAWAVGTWAALCAASPAFGAAGS